MQNSRTWLRLLTMVAALAMTAVACGSNTNSASTTTTTAGTTTTTTAPTTTTTAAQACTQPCAEANGLTVELSNFVYNASSGNQFDTPESGNVFVTVNATFINKSNTNQSVSPFDFKLRSAGVEHSTTLLFGGSCEYWSTVEVTPGASYGPKCLAFEASANQPTGLVVVWKPGLLKTHDIPVS